MSSESPEISQLRIHVDSHPKDARTMALLANLLIMKRVKSSGSSNDQSSIDGPSASNQQESISLAKKSIELSPEDAIGYAVLSTIPAVKFRDRMAFLRTAVDLERVSSNNECAINGLVAIAKSLLRLLIDPREEMARDKDRLAAKRIMRQDITMSGANCLTGLNEQDTYNELESALTTAKNTIWKKREDRWKKYEKGQMLQKNDQPTPFSSVPFNIQCLAKAHYRLGTFFRTMNPHSAHHQKSKHHFYSVLELLNPPHMNDSYRLKSQADLHDLSAKSTFWLGTLEHDQGKTMQVERCPTEYVISLYSKFAANFDNQLVNKLKYETPTKLRHLVDSMLQSPGTEECFSNGADLGCGTGLSGVAFRDLVGNLTGVDLSPHMIDKAKDRQCYESLHIGDVESILKGPDCKFDLVLACDVFVYIGNLQSIFQSVAKCLTPSNGLFAFSTELLDEGQHGVEDAGFVLQSCARFAHTQSYIRNLAKEYGFLVRAMTKDVIRKNGGEDVKGTLTVLSL